MLKATTFAGGSWADMNDARVILDPDTGAPRLANEDDERRRRALIYLYYRMGNEACASYPPQHPEHVKGEALRSTAARLRAFPMTLHLRSREAWGWGLLGFVAGPDWD